MFWIARCLLLVGALQQGPIQSHRKENRTAIRNPRFCIAWSGSLG